MVNNSTNINKTNSHLSAYLTEHKKRPKQMICWICRSLLWTGTIMCKVKPVNGIPSLRTSYNSIHHTNQIQPLWHLDYKQAQKWGRIRSVKGIPTLPSWYNSMHHTNQIEQLWHLDYGQAQTCGRIKHVKGILTPPSWYNSIHHTNQI